jgi:hypothetical protein
MKVSKKGGVISFSDGLQEINIVWLDSVLPENCEFYLTLYGSGQWRIESETFVYQDSSLDAVISHCFGYRTVSFPKWQHSDPMINSLLKAFYRGPTELQLYQDGRVGLCGVVYDGFIEMLTKLVPPCNIKMSDGRTVTVWGTLVSIGYGWKEAGQ